MFAPSHQSQTRSYLEAYRIPSVTRVVNSYFPYPCSFVFSSMSSCVFSDSESVILSERDEEGVSCVHCDRDRFSITQSALQSCSVIHHYHDVQHKNKVIRLLKQCALLTDPSSIDKIMGISVRSGSLHRRGQVFHRANPGLSDVCESSRRLLPLRHRPLPFLRRASGCMQRACGERDGREWWGCEWWCDGQRFSTS